MPALKELLEKGIGGVADYFWTPVKALQEKLEKAFDELARPYGSSGKTLLNLVVLLVLTAITCWLYPRKRGYAYSA